jgi:DNA-binding HxlR family transcriptional regulator
MKAGSKKGSIVLGEFCPRFHRAIELVGRRWTGAIIRILLGGPRRFNEIAAHVPGLSDRLLAERLRELECEGVLRRTVDAGTPVRVDYELTEAGTELQATIQALGAWAERWIPPTTKSRRSRSTSRPRRSISS